MIDVGYSHLKTVTDGFSTHKLRPGQVSVRWDNKTEIYELSNFGKGVVAEFEEWVQSIPWGTDTFTVAGQYPAFEIVTS